MRRCNVFYTATLLMALIVLLCGTSTSGVQPVMGWAGPTGGPGAAYAGETNPPAPGPEGGTTTPPERLPSWEHAEPRPEAREVPAPETVGSIETSHLDTLLWHVERVDTSKNFSNMGPRSLALDTSGYTHIAYGEEHLYYAWYDGSTWRWETVDDSWKVGLYTSLALDGVDQPHISYIDSTGNHLKYAHWDGSSWQIETVDSAEDADTSLALDSQDRPHISYYDDTNRDLKYARGECEPVVGANIEGPAWLPAGINAFYTATYTPITATPPVSFTWDGGVIGPTVIYSWTTPGSYTLSVTATNCGGTASASFAVEVFCQPMQGVDLSGLGALLVGQKSTYRADPRPITASRPLTFTWDSGTVGPAATYSWPATGTYTITVTGTNTCGGEVVGWLLVRVLEEWPYQAYLPLMLRAQ